MKFIFAVLAFTLAVYAVNAQRTGLAYKEVDNACTKLKGINVVMADLLGTWNVYAINFGSNCTKYYFHGHSGYFFGRYSEVPVHFQHRYGVDGQYVQNPKNPSLMERYLDNRDCPLSTKVIIAYEANRYFVCATCDAVDGAPIQFSAVQGRNLSAVEIANLTKQASEITGLNLKAISQDCKSDC